jgi:hypothetical protein
MAALAALFGRPGTVARTTLAARRVRLGLLCLALFAAGFSGAADDAATVLERRVKAALLYRFLNYVEWPDAASSPTPLTIGIVGADALAAELSEVTAGRTINGRPLAVRVVRTADIGRVDTQLLFIGRGEASQLATLLRGVPPGVLIVTESEDALQQGSIINFKLLDGQVRFDISLDAARRRNIRLSSRLLSVAHTVSGAPP